MAAALPSDANVPLYCNVKLPPSDATMLACDRWMICVELPRALLVLFAAVVSVPIAIALTQPDAPPVSLASISTARFRP